MPKIKDLPKHKMPREKLWELGSDNLKDHELLAILLRTGYQGKSALEVAKRILTDFSLQALPSLSMQALARLKGVGISRAASIVAGLELAKRAQQTDDLMTIQSAQEVYKILYMLTYKQKEHLVVLYLNARNQLTHQETVSIGTLNSNLTHPREVFAPAFKHRASSLILAHNHPSGDPTPSLNDIHVTNQLLEAGKILGIDVLDHVIVAKKGFTSLKEKKLI